jgi:phosphonate transport system substrate-binding protein
MRTISRPRAIAATTVILLIVAACGGAAPGGGAPAAPTLGSADRPIVMAFTPSAEVQRITATGNAIAAALNRATGLHWRVQVPTSYATQIEGMCAGNVDVGFIAPLQMTLLLDRKCGSPILAALRLDENRQLSTTYNSQIMVRTDSGLNTLADLRGKKFAFSDPISTSGHLFPLLLVRKETGQEPKAFFSEIIFAGSHPNSVLAVYNRRVDGAASFTDARVRTVGTRELAANMPPDVLEATKVIAKAGPIPNDGIALRKDFPAELGTKVKQALIDYGKTEDGKKNLKDLFAWDGIQEVSASFYDPVLEAAKLAGLDVAAEAAKTPRPAATPTPTGSP